MKYIDADLLSSKIKEIEDEFKTGNYYLDNSEQAVGYINALSDFTNIIDSLQQEQDTIIINKKDWVAQERFRKYKDFGKPLQQEQPELDLEKVAQHVYESWMGGTMDDVRRDMVELGKVLNARKEE